VTAKSDRRAAREAVAAYHEEQLGGLVGHVRLALDGFQAGDLDAFEVDEVIFQYSQAAKELWKFCHLGNIEVSARIVRDEPPIDWWGQGVRRRR
jgi:hypothetical protein